MNRSSPGDLSEIRTRVLRAGRSEKPSSRLLPRTLTAVGAGAAGTLGAAKAAGATGSVLAQAYFWKWIGIGVLGGVVMVGLWQTSSSPGRAAPMAAVAAPSAEAIRGPVGKAAAASEARRDEPVPAAPMSSVAAVRERAAVRPTTATASPPPADTTEGPAAQSARPEPPPAGLAEEIAALDEARRAMEDGDSAAAMRALERHARQFPASQLDHEAAVLRVEALIAQGQCEAARAQGEAFLQANPRSPAAQRMASLLSRPCPPKSP